MDMPESDLPVAEPEIPTPSPEADQQPTRTVTRSGVTYTLLGTAHVSRKSAEAVVELIQSGRFDAVAVELCQSRLDALTGKQDWANLDLYKIIREKKAGLVMANLALGAYQRRIAEQFGIEPGAEMRAAAEEAAKHNLPLQLIDRNVAITLRRSYDSVPWYKRLYLMTGLLLGVVSSEEIDEESIEKLKQGDLLESTFTEFAKHSPELYRALIQERDEYMAAQLRSANRGEDDREVLVVIGAGHMEGMSRALADSQEDPDALCDALNTRKPRARWPKAIPWLIMALVLFGFYLGFSRSPELGWQLVFFWVAINGGLAALGALIARGHPLTVLSGLVAAPLTSLNPTIAAGMVTGLVESWLRKPRVADLENLRRDVTTLKGWFSNPATRILLVFFLSNVGSSIGTWVAGFKIFGALS